MFKILLKILISVGILIFWIIALIWQSVWSNNFSKVSGWFISDFLVLWNMNIEDLYIICKVK